MKVTRMRLKSDFLAEVFVLWSMGNELVPSPQALRGNASTQIRKNNTNSGDT